MKHTPINRLVTASALSLMFAGVLLWGGAGAAQASSAGTFGCSAAPAGSCASGLRDELVAGVTWPSWGNITTADCPFAAAAAWEDSRLGIDPSETAVLSDFYLAGGEETTWMQFMWFWREYGIGGVKAEVVEPFSVEPWTHAVRERVERLIRRRHDVLLDAEWGWGEHEVLVDGVSASRGIRYVTWGQEWWLSWEEAREGVIGEVATVKVLSGPGRDTVAPRL